MNHRTIPILMLIFTLFACSQKKDSFLTNFTNTASIKHENVHMQNGVYFSNVLDIYLINDNLLVYDADENYYFSLFNLKMGSIVRKAGRKGQGPDELIGFPQSVSKMDNETFQFYELNKHQIYTIKSVKSDSISITESKSPKLRKIILNILPTCNHTQITTGLFDKGRYLLLDSCGKEIAYYFDYPTMKNESKFNNKQKAMAFQGCFARRNDGKRFVYATNSSEIIEIIELVDKNKLNKIFEWHGDSGTFTAEGDGITSFSAGISANSVSTFKRICTTQKYIYLLYSGRLYSENYSKVESGNTIFVMDWDGNPVIRYDLDTDIKCIAASDDDKTLYAIAEQDETKLVKFKLIH